MVGRLLLTVVVAALLAGATTGATSAPSALRSGAQPPPSLFGINTGTFDTSEARLSRDLPTAGRLGARWVHFTGDSIKYVTRARELRADGLRGQPGSQPRARGRRSRWAGSAERAR